MNEEIYQKLANLTSKIELLTNEIDIKHVESQITKLQNSTNDLKTQVEQIHKSALTSGAEIGILKQQTLKNCDKLDRLEEKLDKYHSFVSTLIKND